MSTMSSTNKFRIGIGLYLCFILIAVLVANGELLTGSCNNNGQTYYKTLPSACLHVQCVDGHEALQQNHMCRDEKGNCLPQGHIVTVSKCWTKTCVFKENKLYFETTTQACTIDGQCVNVGSTHKVGCFTYGCKAVQLGHSRSLISEIVDMGCQGDAGVCHKVGEKLKTGNCIEKTCQLTDKGIGFQLTKTDCYDSEQNICRAPGVEWTNKYCQRFVCEKTITASGAVNLKVNIKWAGCAGEKPGECHPAGTNFKLRLNNQLQSCQCIGGGDKTQIYSLQYRCSYIV